MYRVIQQVFDLGWVDINLHVPVILPSCFAHYQPRQKWEKQWNSQNRINPTQVRDLLNHPVQKRYPCFNVNQT